MGQGGLLLCSKIIFAQNHKRDKSIYQLVYQLSFFQFHNLSKSTHQIHECKREVAYFNGQKPMTP